MKAIRIISTLAIIFVIQSCEKQVDRESSHSAKGTYILNNGNWGGNDSSIGIYNPSTKSYTPDVFLGVNGVKLGDLGQDMIRVKDEVYIAVNGSQTVFVTDENLKIKKRINAEHNGARLSPRFITSHKDKVYITFYEGFVGEVSSDGTIRLCKVGINPEGIAAADDNLYIANSGGMSYPVYEKTVSVVSIESFTETATIEVNTNPTRLEASSDGKLIYVSSYGNYADQPTRLQVISTLTNSVRNLDYNSVSSIAKGGDILYILCGGYDENMNPLPGTVYRHDMKADKPLGLFINDKTLLKNAYSISVASDGYIYIGCSDYKTTGDVFVFTQEGRLHDSFDSQGMNPLKAL